MAVFETGSQLTEISAKQYQFVTQEDLSANEAVAFLLNGMQFRTFRDVLLRVCGDDRQERKLIKSLSAITPGVQRDSIRRKVKNWYSGKNYPTEREDVFLICFALELDLNQSEQMLQLLTEQGIHYRNPREMVYAYSLRYRLGYPYACRLAEQFTKTTTPDSCDSPVTMYLRQDFQSVKAEEDLFSFMLRHGNNMGTNHNTAYSYFCRMLNLLTGEDLEGEARYSMEYVADTYLRLNMPNNKKSSAYSDVQKMVKKYWPGSRSIKAMKSRSEDVTRKTLLLLYLVTGGIWDGEYDELDESYISPREFLQTHCKRMNRMLTDCAMQCIDPRNVFDYLVLYCLRPEDRVFMSDRMAVLVGEIFK